MASKLISTFRKVRTILPRKKKIEDYYEIKGVIGSGFCSTVKLGIRKKTGEEVALKIIEKDRISDYERENVQTEIDILRHYAHHPNIIQLRDVFEDRKRVVIVLELMQGGELLDHIRAKQFFSEREASNIMRRVVEAVHYLHKNGIVHRDLKPENLLYSTKNEGSTIKIADFGFARYIGDGTLATPCGSPAYVAPEIVKEQEYSKAVDMWSVGVILYILLCGFPPFMGDREDIIFAQIVEGKIDFPEPFWRRVTPSAKDLVSKLLQVDPVKRLTAEETLRHPWIAGITASGEHLLDSSLDKLRADSCELKAAIAKGNEFQRELHPESNTMRVLKQHSPYNTCSAFPLSTATTTTTMNNNNNNHTAHRTKSSQKLRKQRTKREDEGAASGVTHHTRLRKGSTSSTSTSAAALPALNLTQATNTNVVSTSSTLSTSRTRSSSVDSSCSSFSSEEALFLAADMSGR